MLADKKEYVLCDSIYMKFKNSPRLSMVAEIRTEGRDIKETWRVLEMFCIYIWVVVKRIHTEKFLEVWI